MEITTNLETNYDEYVDTQVLYSYPAGTLFTHSAKVSLLTSLQLSNQGYQFFSQSNILQGINKVIHSSSYAFKALTEGFIALSLNLFWLAFLDLLIVYAFGLFILGDQIMLIRAIIKQKKSFEPITSGLLERISGGLIKVHLAILPAFFCFIGACLSTAIFPGVVDHNQPFLKGLESVLALLNPSRAVLAVDKEHLSYIGAIKDEKINFFCNDPLKALSLHFTFSKIHAKKVILI